MADDRRWPRMVGGEPQRPRVAAMAGGIWVFLVVPVTRTPMTSALCPGRPGPPGRAGQSGLVPPTRSSVAWLDQAGLHDQADSADLRGAADVTGRY